MLAERFGWRSIFVTLGALAIIALLQALPRWHESRPSAAALSRHAFGPLLRSLAFWTYTLGFSAAMGTFFVFFSTSPRVLIDKAGYSELQFSLAFATVAIVMIITARFAERFVSRWGTSGSLLRGMCMLLLGAALLIAGETFGVPSSWTFVMPMWVMAVGIVFTVSVTANGALEDFGDMAGSAVAVYFCVQSLIVGTAGTLLVIGLPGDSAWPLVVYASIMAGVVLIARRQLHSRRHVQA